VSDYIEYLTILHSLFENGFMEAYRDASSKKRRRILPYLQAIHRRWYYATLVEHTPFTPANIVESIAAHFNEPSDKCPVVVLRTPAKVAGVDFKVLQYTLENHPAAQDMRILMEYCTPHVDLHASGCLTDEQALDVAKILSINDPHYASFLLELSVWMKLLVKVPSLHVERMQASTKSEKFLDGSNEEILRDIIDAAIQMATAGLRNSMPMPDHMFTESFVRGLLTKPMATDDIFERVFSVMGFDLDELLEASSQPIPEGMSPEHFGMDMELLSGTFVMGIVLDRFFFTPFGHFLRIIRPMYALPFAFYEEVSDYINVCEDPEEAFVAFFAPCSSYTLTDLGLKVLNIAPTSENYFDVSEVPFEGMKDSVFANERAISLFVQMAQQLAPLAAGGRLPGAVLTFRIKLESDSTLWMDLNLPDNFTLQDLYEEIAVYFPLKHNSDFSFFHDRTENRFAEYPSAKRADKTKSPRTTADDCTLGELDFEHINSLILVAYGQGAIFTDEPQTAKLQIELRGEKPPDFDEEYPSVGRMSKKMKTALAE